MPPAQPPAEFPDDAVPEGLVDSVLLPGAGRGRQRKRSAGITIVRSLTSADLPALQNPEKLEQPLGDSLTRMRQTHHQLARVLADGHEPATASAITGYSVGYIRQLTNEDRAFKELLAHYQSAREEVFVDVAERMKNLGLASLDELQHRLEVEPDAWTKSELMALSELALVKGRPGVINAPGLATNGGNGPAMNINIKFVKSSPDPVVIDAEVQEALLPPGDGDE